MKKKVSQLFALAGVLVFAASPVLAGGTTCSAQAAANCTFEQASQHAAQANVPMLIKVGTEWCTACNQFDKDSASMAGLQGALAKNVAFVKIDAEKGEGVDLAKRYHVENFPTFLLTNSKGEVMDRWTGYGNPDKFVTVLNESCQNPVTVADRQARFEKSPSEVDAAKLGDLALSDGHYGDAAMYFRRAGDLNPSSQRNYEHSTFRAVSMGAASNAFTLDEVKQQANAVLSSKKSNDVERLAVAYNMRWVSQKLGHADASTPFLKAAIEQTANATDEKAVGMRKDMMPDYAFQVEKNLDKAIRLKKEAMPAGWMENANELNNFSWWCFENRINLEEAETLARKGVELAEAGTMKANVLDTLAEICNVKGDCGDSLHLIELALAEAPNNEYFQKQLVRFQEAVAAQN